jgi:targeting protein for Xklp2
MKTVEFNIFPKKNESSPEKTKGRRCVPCVPPVRQKVLKITEEQELEKRMKVQQQVVERWKGKKNLRNLLLKEQGSS